MRGSYSLTENVSDSCIQKLKDYTCMQQKCTVTLQQPYKRMQTVAVFILLHFTVDVSDCAINAAMCFIAAFVLFHCT